MQCLKCNSLEAETGELCDICTACYLDQSGKEKNKPPEPIRLDQIFDDTEGAWRQV